MKNLFKKYKHIWILSYAFIYVTWFMYLEKTVVKDYALMHIPLDDFIPFNEYFIVPYLLWFMYVAVTIVYFFFTNKQDYYKLCGFLFAGMTISLIICTIYPNGTNLRPILDADKNIFTAMVAKLYATDTPTNVFPSIHAYNSIGVHIAIVNSKTLSKNKFIHYSSFVLMISICLATVFLKQHSAIDVIGSALMAAILYRLAYQTDYSLLFNKKKLREELQN